TVGVGEHVTCTITNTAQQPTLRLIKSVEQNGATYNPADTDDWTLTGTGDQATPDVISAAGDTGVQNVEVGSYDLTEEPTDSNSDITDGYTNEGWQCKNNGGGAVDGDSVTVALGDNWVCTVTNKA